MGQIDAVFDTNIVIDALRGRPEAEAEYARYDRVYISTLTWIETLSGAVNEERAVRDFIADMFTIVPLTEAIAERTISIRRTHRTLRLPDAIIWATATECRALLVTRDADDFRAKNGGIRIPYR